MCLCICVHVVFTGDRGQRFSESSYSPFKTKRRQHFVTSGNSHTTGLLPCWCECINYTTGVRWAVSCQRQRHVSGPWTQHPTVVISDFSRLKVSLEVIRSVMFTFHISAHVTFTLQDECTVVGVLSATQTLCPFVLHYFLDVRNQLQDSHRAAADAIVSVNKYHTCQV